MQKPPDLKRVPGVFALLHKATAEAYVNETKDLRQRAMLWEMHLSKGRVPAKDFPKYPSDEWEFWVDGIEGATLDDVRQSLAKSGWKIINSYKPRKTYVINGVEGSLATHCQTYSLKVHTVYKRLSRGMTVEQALGLTDFPPMDKRDLSIAQMRVQIESDNGGLLTYNEAVQMRPEIGDVREKVRQLRKKNPELVKVKLSEIPA